MRHKRVCGRCCAPDPTGGAYSAPPDLLAGFGGGEGRIGKGLRRGREREGKGREREGKGEGRERSPPEQKFWLRPCYVIMLASFPKVPKT